jgi:hypothetical protein
VVESEMKISFATNCSDDQRKDDGYKKRGGKL